MNKGVLPKHNIPLLNKSRFKPEMPIYVNIHKTTRRQWGDKCQKYGDGGIATIHLYLYGRC